MLKKRVLVTGADGFIGSHLVELLLAKDFQVTALAQYNSFNTWGWLESVPKHPNLTIISGDVRDPFFCQKITREIDTIFHLAALIAIPYSYSAPQSYVATNINGTLNLCQAALENQVSRFIHTSTSEVYGTAQYVPIDEKHPLQAQSPYSASKIGADAMAMSYYNAFNLPLSIARPFNTYGPRQSARAIIPTIISQIANGEKQIKLGDLTPTRDFNYVGDTCRGFLAIAESDQAIGEVVNIGSNFEISMADTLNLIKEIMQSDVEFISDEERIRPSKSEVFRLWCDNKKIQTLSEFTPAYSIKQGLTATVNWFLKPENLRLYKHDIYNL
ncbi:NAD dependent epimerase/dehydratase, LLPSF_EDH_00030 family [Colwellia chukchiensis]|uniref:NAD dependent epimerase/dehydratase, LLPSF_EDH_00030 family n=1 Tax=Colwellia chukchiensis TaxID=641665 RepID=A0A1H7HGV4_9GAMM|nr:NAD-dependent 4,6-dehydratase LegB [Colwellia chukchiensis]SEK49603.1 NAD dependent epimerase/dehydratase, LLPSF_EDH_00030 family [Colwellia chukchiensis]